MAAANITRRRLFAVSIAAVARGLFPTPAAAETKAHLIMAQARFVWSPTGQFYEFTYGFDGGSIDPNTVLFWGSDSSDDDFRLQAGVYYRTFADHNGKVLEREGHAETDDYLLRNVRSAIFSYDPLPEYQLLSPEVPVPGLPTVSLDCVETCNESETFCGLNPRFAHRLVADGRCPEVAIAEGVAFTFWEDENTINYGVGPRKVVACRAVIWTGSSATQS